MKKFTKICLSILMVMALALSLVGCGITDMLNNFGDGDENGGGNNGETQTENMKSKKEIETALGDNYEITLKYGFSSSEDDAEASFITTKCVGDTLYTVVTSENNVDAYLVVGNKAYTNYNSATKKFSHCSLITEYDPYPNVYKQLMMGYENSLSYNSKKSGKFLDRNVTIYEWKETATVVIATATYEWEYVVDNETGLLLKQSLNYSGSSVEGASSASLCFEVTNMKLGGLTMTEEMKKISIDEWPTQQDFTTFGITNIAKIDEEFTYSRAIIEDTGIASELEYIYKVTDATIFETLSQSFYNAGFIKNYDCENKTLAELTSVNEYTNIQEFKGYIGQPNQYADFGVEIELQPPFNEGGKYTLSITLYNNNAMSDIG